MVLCTLPAQFAWSHSKVSNIGIISCCSQLLRDDMPFNVGTPFNLVCLLMFDMPINVTVRLIMFSTDCYNHVLVDKHCCLHSFMKVCRFLDCFTV